MAKILVIDDEEILLDLISNALRLEGHDVVPLNNPLAALQLKTARPFAFDLIVSDIHTKPISGFELAKRLAIAGINCPILFMSGDAALAAAIAGASGNRSLLEKPFTAQQLRAAVKKALNRNKEATV